MDKNMELRKFIATTIREYLNEHVENTDNDLKILFDIAKELSEKMYCDVYGSCVHFAELFVEKVEEENAILLGDFNV